MAGFEGLDKFITEVRNIPKRVEQKGKELTGDVAQTVVVDAVSNLRANRSTNYGVLMQSIDSLPKNGGLKWDIVARAEYAPSIEFGTKGKVDFSGQPLDQQTILRSYAAQFKGTPTGTWDEFLIAIKDWVKRKGITGVYSVKTRKRLTGKKYNNDAEDERVAFLIARSIYRHGVTAKPFFFPAYFKGQKEFERELEKMMKVTIWQRIKNLFRRS